jgi:hypothetical protein
MPTELCQITPEEIGALFSPEDDPNFINPNYVEPIKQPAVWAQFKIYVGNTAYEFNRHVVSQSYADELIWASRSSCTFQIDDNNKNGFNLPFTPVRFQKVRVYDATGAVCLGHWYIRNVIGNEYGERRADGTYMRLLDIECEDAWSLLEARIYSETYQNKTAGYILADTITRAGLDASQIDVTAGPVLEQFPVNNDYPSAVAERIMSLLDWTYWLDVQYDPPRVYAGTKDSELTRCNLEINEDNIWKIFSKLDIHEAAEDYANEIYFQYRRKYNKGTANFENGTNVVVGYSGDEDWYQLDNSQGLEIENINTGVVYRIQKNNSTPAGVNEFILSSNYAEATATNQPYAVRGALTPIRRRNDEAVMRLKSIQGGDGVRSKLVVRDDASYTYAEAALIANFELSLYSREYYRGAGDIDTSYHADWNNFYPGKTLPFNLPISKKITSNVRIETVRRRDLGSPQTFPDGRRMFAMGIEITFTPSMYSDYEQIRALFRSTRKLEKIDSNYVTDAIFFENYLAVKTCVHIIEPIKAELSEMEIDNMAATLEFPAEIGYTELSYTYHPGYVSVTSG